MGAGPHRPSRRPNRLGLGEPVWLHASAALSCESGRSRAWPTHRGLSRDLQPHVDAIKSARGQPCLPSAVRCGGARQQDRHFTLRQSPQAVDPGHVASVNAGSASRLDVYTRSRTMTSNAPYRSSWARTAASTRLRVSTRPPRRISSAASINASAARRIDVADTLEVHEHPPDGRLGCRSPPNAAVGSQATVSVKAMATTATAAAPTGWKLARGRPPHPARLPATRWCRTALGRSPRRHRWPDQWRTARRSVPTIRSAIVPSSSPAAGPRPPSAT